MLRWSFCYGFVSFPDIGSWKCDSSLCWLLNFFIVFSLVGFHWFSNSIWAWPQETCPVSHTDSEYPWKTACCTSRRHWDNSIPLSNHFPWAPGDSRQGSGCQMWFQLVGIWMVLWYVMKRAVGVSVVPHGVRFHVHTPSTMFGALSSWLWRTYTYSS
jgi:hypothetical protein